MRIDAAGRRALGDLLRPFSLDQDTLMISAAPSRDPHTGEDVLYRLVFSKRGRAARSVLI